MQFTNSCFVPCLDNNQSFDMQSKPAPETPASHMDPLETSDRSVGKVWAFGIVGGLISIMFCIFKNISNLKYATP